MQRFKSLLILTIIQTSYGSDLEVALQKVKDAVNKPDSLTGAVAAAYKGCNIEAEINKAIRTVASQMVETHNACRTPLSTRNEFTFRDYFVARNIIPELYPEGPKYHP